MKKAKAIVPQRGKPFAWAEQSKNRFRPAPLDLADLGWAYREAARVLYGAMGKDGNSLSAFPLVFLYRHAMEAYVKAILLTIGSDLGITKERITGRKHDLRKQVPDLVKVSNLVGLSIKKPTVDAISQIGGQDPKGEAFRYASRMTPEGDFVLAHFVKEVEFALDELELLLNAVKDALWRRIMNEEGIE